MQQPCPVVHGRCVHPELSHDGDDDATTMSVDALSVASWADVETAEIQGCCPSSSACGSAEHGLCASWEL